MAMRLPALALACCLLAATARAAVLDNTKLPLDQNGEKLTTGEAGVLHHNGAFFFYFNDWNIGSDGKPTTCPGVNCCASSGGCAGCCYADPPTPMRPDCANLTNGSDPYGDYHQFVAYSTTDFKTWTYLGIAMPLSARRAGEI